MRARPANTIPLLGMLVLLATGTHARAGQAITDDGKFFSADAIQSAEAIIRQIQMVHQKDLRVETFPEIPKELLPQFQQQGKQKFFEQWTNDRATQQRVNGVYILICRNPGRLQVWVDNATGRRLFTAGDRDFLVQKLTPFLHRHEYDAGLLAAVRFVQRQMDDRSKATEDPNAPLLVPPLPSGEASGLGDCPRAGWGEGELRTTPLSTDNQCCHPERSEGSLNRATQSAQRSFASDQDDKGSRIPIETSLGDKP
jgi:uncharacterized membrane protein YgcG